MTIEARVRRLERASRASDSAALVWRDVLALRAYLSAPEGGVIHPLRAIGPSPLRNHLIADVERDDNEPADGWDGSDGL